MKTAISIPTAVFTLTELKANELGMSRSQFFTIAAQRYLRDLSESDLISQINEAVDLENEVSRAETTQFVNVAVASSQQRHGSEQW